MFRRGESQGATIAEPQPLGVDIDPASAALYDEFAKDRGFDQVYALWQDPQVTNPTIRQRAVAVLTAPYGVKLPYPHTEQTIGKLINKSEEIDGQQTSSLRARMAGRPELAEELSQGLIYWLETTGGSTPGALLDSRHDYHRAIQELLPIVKEETADKLFAYYPINDIKPFQSMDDSSGYRPIINLFYDRQLPQKYKDAGLAKWLEVAAQEVGGTAQPRTEHERATKKLAEFVQSWTYGDSVNDATSTAIITFLESQTPAGTTYTDRYVATQVANHITDEDVRFNFAWRHVVAGSWDDWLQFQVNNEADLALVDWMRGEAQKRELPEFDARADALVKDYERRRVELMAQHVAELALQARLRA